MDYQVLSIDELVRECVERPCPEAWAEFIRRFRRLIGSVVIRTCLEFQETRPDVFEDLIQKTYLKLCTNNYAVLKRFVPRHENSFLGYLKVVTANVVRDHFREEKDERNKTAELDPAIQASQSNNSENEIIFNKIDRILRKRGNGPQETKERAIFWLYFRHGMTAKEIASIPAMNLTVKGVESCIFRLLVYVRKMLFGDRPGGTPGGIPPA